MSGMIGSLRGPAQRHLLLDFCGFLPASKRDWYRRILACASYP